MTKSGDSSWEYQQKDRQEKVGEVFNAVSPYYDYMNDFMSLGLHRLWKRQALYISRLSPKQHVLEVACGSGDVSMLIADKLHDPATLCITDPNADLLQQARDRLLDRGYSNVASKIAYAEDLPFADASFDHIIISFGLRNATDRNQALHEFSRVLTKNGDITILEFTKPPLVLVNKLRRAWMQSLMVPLASKLFNDQSSYTYLEESIARHPDMTTLSKEISSANFTRVHACYLSGGLVALHRAIRV